MGARERRAEQAIKQAWPGKLGKQVLAGVRDEDAFGALAWHLDQISTNGADPVAVLRQIDKDTLEWALEDADNPAAFLASRVRDS
jgi:hypothetical protein